MKTNEIKYLDLVNNIIKYLNENNPGDNYIFTELYRWGDDVDVGGEVPCAWRDIYGVIIKQGSVSDKTYELFDEYDYTRSKEISVKHLLENDIIYCYKVKDRSTDALRYSYSKLYRRIKSRMHINPKAIINIDDAFLYFKSIDEELLNNVVSNIKNGKQKVLMRKNIF